MPQSPLPPRSARSTLAEHDSGPTAQVLAAGVVPWRVTDRGLEVLLIHRPHYDDWSWPKGKLDEGETLPECARREVFEEIGLRVTLGLPLPITRYTVGNGRKAAKEVWYWAAEAGRSSPVPDGDEVDRTRWVTADQARDLLTNATDALPLDALIAAHRDRILRTAPFVVLRHAKAKPRATWSRAEGQRPLAATGRRQALAVRRLLAVWDPQKVITSPWLRCVETVTPFVKDTRRGLKEISALTEKKAHHKPHRTRQEVARLLDKARSTVMCTHRPVLPLVLEVLSHGVDPAVVAALPREDPYLPPGAVIVAHQALDRGGRIVAVETYDVWDD